ncbi:protein of unknown function [Jatrophihabitans endophyticus]|uniref:DUF4395 domain-containing protein n=1 Tax=Jatrophihabitans endophyticus TaxID=1206085 RepID=A0A1M5BVB9_9ACTN|nr:DUF4395 domain-containing protein [Jatrophihabitans endophyticus]SHF46504.1 protein of unknown function [Jatrophihabitans endophyticus]
MTSLLGFPNPVNEKAARTVAAGVALLCALTLALAATLGSGWLWLSVPIALGFVARVLTGPRLSPLGRLATEVVAPRLGPATLVPGPPKRFAQGMGATLTVAAVVLLAMDVPAATVVLLALVVVAAVLESALAFCLGCRVFAVLMRLGLIPAETCEACANLGSRPRTV